MTNAVDDDDDDDPRERPEYEFLYKQAISTADNYLGMAYVHKDPGSLSCEDLVVRIELPGALAAGPCGAGERGAGEWEGARGSSDAGIREGATACGAAAGRVWLRADSGAAPRVDLA